MKRNLFIYESTYGTTKRTAEICALLAANSKVCNVKDIKADINLYDNIIFAIGFHGLDTGDFTKKFIKKEREILNLKNVSYSFLFTEK